MEDSCIYVRDLAGMDHKKCTTGVCTCYQLLAGLMVSSWTDGVYLDWWRLPGLMASIDDVVDHWLMDMEKKSISA